MTTIRLAATATLLLAPAPLAAQVVQASARGAGMADAYGALARGAAAAFYNPALLGLRDNPGFTLLLPSASVTGGAGPITLRDYRDYQGLVVPDAVKREWLNRIPAGGTQNSDAVADIGAFGLQAGPFAITAGAVGNAEVGLPRGAVDLFLFGNVDSLGRPRDVTFQNGRAEGYGIGFVAASLGIPVWTRGKGDAQERVSIGVTGRWVGGGGMFNLWSVNGGISASPIQGTLTFPTAIVYKQGGGLAGQGVGVDVGLAWQSKSLVLAVAATDAYNSFRWDATARRIVNGRAFFSADSTRDNTTEVALSDPSIPAALRDSATRRIDDAIFKPSFRASLAWTPSRKLAITGDLLRRTATGDNLQAGVRTVLSGGVEYRLIGFLPVRGGVAVMDGGTLWTVGTGLELGVVNVNVAYGQRRGDLGRAERVAVGVAFGNGR
ncbi:MAG: hypothetical protein NW201_07665 [Gemmatimonadales bacterium]|nr:hypothetical protein [Gemmatimonadales bacterium]